MVIRALVSIPNAIFLIAGDGPLRAELEALAKKLNVDHRVRFLGSVPYKEIHTIVAAGDVFVRASRSEGFGNSFIEAMRSEEHTSELQSHHDLVCRLLLEKKKKT